MKKLLLTFLVSASIVITLFMTNMTVSASEANECNSELQSCSVIRHEITLANDVGEHYFYSININGTLYRGWLGRRSCMGGCLYTGWLVPDPCPYPTPFSKPIDVTVEK